MNCDDPFKKTSDFFLRKEDYFFTGILVIIHKTKRAAAFSLQKARTALAFKTPASYNNSILSPRDAGKVLPP
jgi:hypothetical protein